MSALLAHLILVPIVLPLVTAAVLLLLGDRRRRLQSLINIAACALGIVAAALLVLLVDRGDVAVYLAANWKAPFGIVLVADRLSAMMLLLMSVVSLCAALHAEAAWARVGVYFRPLFQVQIMGLSGAFLTGDLFNLFVFFEVMLAASYGLQLHGSGQPRVRSGLHYIAVNLVASALFLVGLAVLYGVLGTLSMADIAAKLSLVPAQDRGLLHAGAAILAVAFLIKAAIWPLNAWLVPAYTAASAPVAALFAVMTKVGIYTLLRLWSLFFSRDGPSFELGRSVLFYGGLATLVAGAIGLLTTVRIERIAGFAIIVSSGTLLSAISVGSINLTSAALFYVLTATFAASALFLLVELIERIGANRQQLQEHYVEPGEDTNLDDAQLPLVGRVFPVSLALIGLAFMLCALLVAGFPPLSGFLAKLSLLTSILGSERGVTWGSWAFLALILLASLASLVSFARAGIQTLWSTGDRSAPEVKGAEAAAVVTLLLCCALLTAFAEPVLRYTRATAEQLHVPPVYIEHVLSTEGRPR